MEEKINDTQKHLCQEYGYKNLENCKHFNLCNKFTKCKINDNMLLCVKKNKSSNISIAVDTSIENSINEFIKLLNGFSSDIYKI